MRDYLDGEVKCFVFEASANVENDVAQTHGCVRIHIFEGLHHSLYRLTCPPSYLRDVLQLGKKNRLALPILQEELEVAQG